MCLVRTFFKYLGFGIPGCVEISAELDDMVLEITDFVASLAYFGNDLEAFGRVVREVGVDENEFRFMCWYFDH